MLSRLREYRRLGEAAIRQLDDAQIGWAPSPGDNSIEVIVRHLHGNMLSRFTDFLTSDGEKPWRNRDGEFAEGGTASREQVLRWWEEGWDCVEQALSPLGDADLGRKVSIRTEPYTVADAVIRQVAHYAYHVGQIVYLAKLQRGEAWVSLSIPRGASGAFNREMAQRFSSPGSGSK